MPFSPIFKAGLLAVVLVILNHVARLSAAPVISREPWTSAIGQARNFFDDHVGVSDHSAFETGSSTPMDLDPATDHHRSYSHLAPSPSRPYDAAQGAYHQPPYYPVNEPEARALGHYVQPAGLASTASYSEQSWIPPNGTPDIGVEGATLERGKGWTWKPNAVDQARSGSKAAAAHAGENGIVVPIPIRPYAIHFWSGDDFEAMVRSTEWKQLDRESKAHAIKEAAQMVFSKHSYEELQPLTVKDVKGLEGERFRLSNERVRTLVKESLKLRLEGNLASRVKVKLDVDNLPSAAYFFRLLPETIKSINGNEAPARSFLDYDSEKKLKSFPLGAFQVYLVGTTNKRRGYYFWDRGQMVPEKVRVVAVTTNNQEKIYIGEATITPEGTPLDQSRLAKTQGGSKSKSRRPMA